MFYWGFVMDWQVPGEKRVRSKTTGDLYILNTNRMFEITESYTGKATMLFFDSGLDEKDSGNRLRVDDTVAVTTSHADNDHGSESIALSYFPEGDITATPTTVTVRKADIAYCYPRNSDILSDYTYVVYREGAWNMKKILVDSSWLLLWGDLED